MDTKTSQQKTIELTPDSSDKTSQTVTHKNYVPEEFFIKFETLETEINETSFDDEIKVTFLSNSKFELSKIEDPFKHKNSLSEKFKSATKSGNRENRRYRGNRRGNRGRHRSRGNLDSYRSRGNRRGNRGGSQGKYRGKSQGKYRGKSSGYAKQVNRFEYLAQKVSAFDQV